MAMLEIFLEEMTFYAYHGVLPQEQRVGNTFVLSLTLRLGALPRAVVNDELGDTISYAEVYDVVREEMAVPSQLLEHVVGRIAVRLFESFDALEGLELRLAKQKPPISGDLRQAGVSLRLSRDEVLQLNSSN